MFPPRLHPTTSLETWHRYIKFRRKCCDGPDQSVVIRSPEAYSNVPQQTFIICTHCYCTHTEPFAFEELCDFLINFLKCNESLKRVVCADVNYGPVSAALSMATPSSACHRVRDEGIKMFSHYAATTVSIFLLQTRLSRGPAGLVEPPAGRQENNRKLRCYARNMQFSCYSFSMTKRKVNLNKWTKLSVNKPGFYLSTKRGMEHRLYRMALFILVSNIELEYRASVWSGKCYLSYLPANIIQSKCSKTKLLETPFMRHQ